MTLLIAALAVGAGLALAVISILQRAKERDDDLAAILQLPFGERDVPIEAVTESRAALLERTVSLAAGGLEHFNLMARVAGELERARLPLRPGEFVLAAGGGGAALGVLVFLLTGQLLLGVLSAVAGPFLAWNFVKLQVSRRRKAFEAQLPDALALIASSLQAGHTALRSVQSMVEESEAPLSEEFERVVAETALGDPLVDALDRMANRLDVEDLAWVVQAIRIQQTVGGKLADLLFTLADFMRAREEIRREVKVLTAEGRMSAWVLGGLPVLLFFAVQTMSPGYLDPMLRTPGVFALIGAGISVAVGIGLIMRMVKIDI
ncbi:MAG TPA: type II secretion system F family protein [Acidimicrobiia bacterium]|nr:type II secretion system F family protein [Acidimicrobiia bacterium]